MTSKNDKGPERQMTQRRKSNLIRTQIPITWSKNIKMIEIKKLMAFYLWIKVS